MNQLVKKNSSTAAINDTESSNEINQFLTFVVGEETFALNILPIKEIIEYNKITKVPMVPDFIRGVINLRGNVVPVIDLSARFSWKKSEVTKRTCIIIVEVENETEQLDIGIVVDVVNEVLDLQDVDIEPPPALGAKIRTDFISGMGKVNDTFIILLEIGKILSIEELSVLGSMNKV